MKESLLVGLILLVGLSELLAQPQLALLKNDKIITRFEEGEYIRFQRKGEEGYIRAIIIGIHPGFFIVGEDSIYTYDVSKIDIRKRTLTSYKISSIGKGLVKAGGLLMVADLFNKTVILDKKYEINNSTARASLFLVGVGGFMQVVNNDTFKTSHKKKLATLNVK